MNNLPKSDRSNLETYLLARLKEIGKQRPLLDNLGEDLFPIDLKKNDIIEITGDTCTGKSYVLLDIIARSILPVQCFGKEATVVFFNLDHKFCIVHFMKVLEKYVIACTKNLESEFLDGEMKAIVTNSLRRLKIYTCYSDDDFNLSLRNLDQHLFKNSSISLIAIDSINCFYWLEAHTSTQNHNRNPSENTNKYNLKIETHYERTIDKLKKIAEQYNVSIVFTQHQHYANKHKKILTNFQINLSKLKQNKDNLDSEQEFEMVLNYNGNTFFRPYHLKADGLNILTNQAEI